MIFSQHTRLHEQTTGLCYSAACAQSCLSSSACLRRRFFLSNLVGFELTSTSDSQKYLESRILKQGDVILLAFGGHGFEMLEASEIIEVKQGPFAGGADKNAF